MRGTRIYLALALAALIGLGGYTLYARQAATKRTTALQASVDQQKKDAEKAQADLAASKQEGDKLRRTLGGIQATIALRPGVDKPEAVVDAFFKELQAGHYDYATLFIEKDSLIPADWHKGIQSYRSLNVDASGTGATVWVRVNWTDAAGKDQAASWAATVGQRNDIVGRPIWIITGLEQAQPGS